MRLTSKYEALTSHFFPTKNRSHFFKMHKRDRSGKERPPPHLKGREIGMFYAQRSKAKKEQLKKQELGWIQLSGAKRTQIQSILDSTSFRSLFVTDGSYANVEDSVFKRDFLRVINESIDDKLAKLAPVIEVEDSSLNDQLYNEFVAKRSNPKYLEMLNKRTTLPAFNMKDEILKVVGENQIVVISGETGCGKTTQVAQFILDDCIERGRGGQCKVLCTQPRRISAITVAQRVAEERAEALGHSVGYHIRLENELPRERGCICFCTTGVVLRIMQSDASLSTVSHLVLDEIHERDVMSDFILALIKKVLAKRKELKVILMSATLNSQKFSSYYNNCPHLNIPGFTYPVQEFYLEDVLLRTNFVFEHTKVKRKDAEAYNGFIAPHVRLLEANKEYTRHVCEQLRNPESERLNLFLILQLLIHICEKADGDGAILVFLTGFQEISGLIKLMNESGAFPRGKYVIYPLHSLMPTAEQRQIFQKPPHGVRKIVVATNIAETSITIDDVVYVVDCGKIKMSSFDVQANSEVLAPEWVSLANANQRKGRAGRVKPGVCFHLFSKARNLLLEQYQLPEILRTRLESVILTAKVLQLGEIVPFFGELIDPPESEAVEMALERLRRLNALTEDEKLTPLGYHLAKLPIEPQLGKMILFGAIFSCLDPVLSIAATLGYKEPFQLPVGKEKEADYMKRELGRDLKSDHLLYHQVLSEFEEENNQRQFCWKYFLNQSTVRQLLDMKQQFMQYLHEMNFVPNSHPKTLECNRNSNNLSLIKAVICASLYPNITFSKEPGRPPVWTPSLKKLELHPKSILAGSRHFDSNVLVYYRKVFSSKYYIYDASVVRYLPLVFFADDFLQTHEQGSSMIALNEHVKFKCADNTTRIIKELRDRFNWFLAYKISHPGPVIWGQSDETKVLEVIMDLITDEEEVHNDMGTQQIVRR